MNYKEKYNEALKSMRGLYNKMKYLSSIDALATAVTLEKAFPELAESEDEWIRKEIIELVQFYYGSSLVCKHTVSKDDMIAWLEKQKHAEWSEEDEKIRRELYSFVENWRIYDPDNPFEDYPIYTSDEDECYKYLEWLKSIKPQKHWKPSEEQMEALKKRTHGLHTSSETRKALESLINDLKTL